jgi:ribosomal protein S18 acetylase RimI-like enzyme
MKHHAPIRRLVPADAPALTEFFAAVNADADTVRLFHPHPFTRDEAIRVCDAARRDLYFAAWDGDAIVGYSMLRGWEEGYAVPSFGVCVHPQRRGTGLGSELTRHAVEQCRALGAPSLRLTVYKENRRAAQLYRNLGFELSDLDDARFVGLLPLAAAAAR